MCLFIKFMQKPNLVDKKQFGLYKYICKIYSIKKEHCNLEVIYTCASLIARVI